MADIQAPSVGRIVHYKPLDNKDGKPYAAIITDVLTIEEKTVEGEPTGEKYTAVNLTVFEPDGKQMSAQKVRQGAESGNWDWPART